MPKLFVLNGKKEDLVADVVLVSDSDVFSGINKLEKVVVTDYSREQIVLDSRSSDTLSANQKGRVLPTNTENSKKIAGFGAYLFDRRKAAVFTCGNVRYFILPSETKESSSNLQCIYLPKAEHKEQAKPISAQASVSAEKSVVHAAPMGSKTGGKGFLDSLIQTVESTSRLRQDTTLAVGYGESQYKKSMQALEKRVRMELESFDEDPDKTEHAFEPMEKHFRVLIHDIVSENDYLVSISSGEIDDRHVIVYRKGFQPEEESAPIVYEGKVLSKQKIKTKAVEPNNVPLALTTVGTVKRDRRTMEMLEQDILKKKKL